VPAGYGATAVTQRYAASETRRGREARKHGRGKEEGRERQPGTVGQPLIARQGPAGRRRPRSGAGTARQPPPSYGNSVDGTLLS